MKKVANGTVLLAIFLAALPCRAQRVEAMLSVDSAAVGERFALTIIALHGFAGQPSFPAAAGQDSTFGDLEVLGIRGAGSRALDGANLDSIIYDVTSFALDSALLPSMTVSFDGGAVDASTAPLVLPMISVVPPQADGVRDIATLVDFGVPIWPYVLLGLATIAAAALLVYFLRRPKQPLVLEAAPTAARLSPYEEALRRLRRLEGASPTRPTDVKPYYVELSATVRGYLEGALGIPALERTTHELMQEFEKATIQHLVPGGLPAHTRTALDLADLVKFAEFLPGSSRHGGGVG